MKNIAVFFGGRSVEHDISLITGVMTANSIDREKFSVLPVLIDKDGKWYTGEKLLDLDGYKDLDYKKLKRVTIVNGDNTLYQIKGKKLVPIEKIFSSINCMHGEYGEDGSLVGLLKMSDIPFCSPDLLSSSISIDKYFTKTVMKGLDVLTVDGELVYDSNNLDKVVKRLSFPLIVKPNFLGSSIGVTKVNNLEQLNQAVKLALKYGKSVLIEKCLNDIEEINCSAYFDGQKIVVSECEKPILKGEFLTFNDKYRKGKREFPANIPKEHSDKIKKITKQVYEALQFKGIIRIDYFLCNQKVYLNEINSVPGSLAYYLFCDTLKGFTNLLTDLIMACEKEYLKEKQVVREFKSGIIGGFGSKGSKRL